MQSAGRYEQSDGSQIGGATNSTHTNADGCKSRMRLLRQGRHEHLSTDSSKTVSARTSQHVRVSLCLPYMPHIYGVPHPHRIYNCNKDQTEGSWLLPQHKVWCRFKALINCNLRSILKCQKTHHAPSQYAGASLENARYGYHKSPREYCIEAGQKKSLGSYSRTKGRHHTTDTIIAALDSCSRVTAAGW